MNKIMLILLLFGFLYAMSQDKEVKEVEIFATKTKPVATKIIAVDSLILKYYKYNNLGDLLQEQTGVFVKNYGGAGIATISLRGSNASQTPVLWQGFNIQNRMLGQSDLSTISSFLFDMVSVQYTPNSGALGNGHIGGAIILDNSKNRNINKSNTGEGSLSYASFKSPGAFAKYIYNGKRIQLQAKLSGQYQENNYSFINESLPGKPLQNLEHAQMSNLNGMVDLYYSKKEILFDCHYWYSHTLRNLPPTLLQQTSFAKQEDESNRIAMDYQYFFPGSRLVIRNGLFLDKIYFTDSIASIYGRDKSYVDELDVSWKKKWHETLIFEGGSNVSMNIVKSNFYRDGTLSQPRGGLYLFAMESFRKIISLSANIRAEAIANYKYTPLTGSIGAKTRLSKRSDLGLQSSRNFRYPTFNDLYWQPGGNPNLKPEYSINNEITWHQGIDSLQNSFFEATIFYKDIRNYIQWVPAYQGIWTPENALHVTVTGAEFNFKGTRNCGKTMIKLLANYGYTMALNKEVYQSNSNSLGKQLIYIPPHKFNLSIYALRKNIMLMYNLNFIGYRYITSDNTDYLQGFVLHNIKAGYDKKIGYKTINISGSVNNLLNKNYLLVAARPMPRRSFIFSLSFYL